MLPHSQRNLVSRVLFVTLAAGALGLAGCKKKVKPPPPPPPPQTVEVKLQVTSISPSQVNPNTQTPAKVFGSEFKSGATVHLVGSTEAAALEVRVLDSNTISLTVPALAEGSYDVRVTNPDGERSTLRQGLNVKSMELACRSNLVNFAFDDAALTNNARGALDRAMACYQSEAQAIRIEGHCDERGTIEYNLALGQRRADSVKRHLVNGGVATGKISTTSFGKERPIDSARNEGAWAKNRRAEISASR